MKNNKLTSQEVQIGTTDWLNEFLQVYQRSAVTPYIHIFVAHAHEIIQLYGDINKFTCQGIEKLNDLETMYYFRSNNKQKNTDLIELLQKRNRIEFNYYSNEQTQ